MDLLILGFIVFVGVHLLASVPALRDRVVVWLGLGPYKGVFSLASFVGIAFIALGKGRAEFLSLWQPPAWGVAVPRLAMPLSFMLLAGAYLPGNVKRVTRHPMLWGVVLWAVSHLAANGDLASVVLFGAFAAYALFAMWSQNRRGRELQIAQRPHREDALVIAVGLAAYVAVGLTHRYLFGVPAFN